MLSARASDLLFTTLHRAFMLNVDMPSFAKKYFTLNVVISIVVMLNVVVPFSVRAEMDL